MPTFYQLLLKIHTLTILLTAPQTVTVASLKHEAFTALASDVNQVDHVSKVTSEDEFEICKVRREKGKPAMRTYDILDGSLVIKPCLANWEILFIRFRDDKSGELKPVEYTQPALTYDDDDEPRVTPGPPFESPSKKGKRKVPVD